MPVDAFRRELKFPPKFVPYLEKHRIYEMFYDLAKDLAMVRPKDPLVHLRNGLERMERLRDQRVVLLMTPPFLDRTRLAQLLSRKTGYRGVLSRYRVCLKPGDHFDPKAIAVNTAAVINKLDDQGWILADYPDTKEEAKMLIQNGVLPTHAFLLLADDEDDKGENIRTVETTPSVLLEFDNSIYSLEELFKSSLKVVKIKNRSLEDIAELCANLVEKMPPRPAPKLFRLALIGPRGSRRRTLAKLLNKQFNIVHVDMLELINAAKVRDNEIGDKVRFLDRNGCQVPVKIAFDLLKSRLYQKDCMEHGYVLTNFPCSLADFVLLDSIDTPPNRVIFLDVDDDECVARLEDRVVNMYTGELHSRRAIQANELLRSQTLPHPDDEPRKVAEEIKFYNERAEAMMDYCGKTASMINARGPIFSLLERVHAVLMGPAPTAKPRTGQMPSAPISNSQEKTVTSASVEERTTYPISRIEVVPFIDSEDLMRRYKELKGEVDVASVQSRDLLSTNSELMSVIPMGESASKKFEDFEKDGLATSPHSGP